MNLDSSHNKKVHHGSLCVMIRVSNKTNHTKGVITQWITLILTQTIRKINTDLKWNVQLLNTY